MAKNSIMEALRLKWSRMIVYKLEEGPKNYSRLKDELKLSSKVLSSTLRALQKHNLIIRSVSEDRSTTYALTEKGHKIAKILHELNFLGENR
jgi:DNA-binding HxlR family transcriptional regulator